MVDRHYEDCASSAYERPLKSARIFILGNPGKSSFIAAPRPIRNTYFYPEKLELRILQPQIFLFRK